MVNIILKTIKGGEITPQDDAIIYQATVQSGIFDGCEVAVSNTNTLNITGGFGMIAGRYFRMTDSSIDVTLPLSENLKGRLYFHLDLQNADEPLKLLVATGATLAELQIDERVNITESVYQMELASFDVTPTGIENLVEKRGGMNSISKELAENKASLEESYKKYTENVQVELDKVYKEQAEINQKLTGPFKASVTYHVDVDRDLHKEILQGNDAIKDAPAPVKEGWTLKGWAKTADANAELIDAWPITVTETLEFYAVFEQTQVKTVTVTFDANEGVGSIEPMIVNLSSLLYNNGDESSVADKTAPTSGITKTGYQLVGWTPTNASAGNAVIEPGDYITVTEDTILQAVWLANNTVKSFGIVRAVQSYTIPASGIYKLEVWGAGAYGSSSAKGGHAYGYAKLKRGNQIYICVGGRGETYGSNNYASGGYNGGGDGAWKGSAVAYGGSGCTHIAKITGTLHEIGIGCKDYVMIVAGGAGGGRSTFDGGNGGGPTGDGKELSRGGSIEAVTESTFGQGVSAPSGESEDYTYGGGGGGYCGGGVISDIKYSNRCSGGGGCGYIDGVPEFVADGVRYAPFQENGVQGGDGKAEITFIKFYKRGM